VIVLCFLISLILTNGVHNNNNLWTGFDELNGDVGNRDNSMMEYPGESEIDHILRGCFGIGFTNSFNDTIVVSNKIC